MKNQQLKSNHPFSRLTIILLGFVLIALAISCGNTTTTEATDEAATDEAAAATEAETKTPIEQGKEWYISYCVMCHGEDGKGGGALADSLRVPPLDLTTIAMRRGEFDRDLMIKIIAGDEEVPGHTTIDMPAWLETFKESERISDEAVLYEKIGHIVTYLESMQVSESAAE
jgi:mono/diheme cytochrome c family protein